VAPRFLISALCVSLFAITQALPLLAQSNAADAVTTRTEVLKSQEKQLADSVTVVGYMAPYAVLSFTNNPRQVIFAKQGETVNGITLASVNGAAVLAKSNGINFSMAGTDKPFPIAEYALQDYLVNLCRKIDSLTPGVTETHRVTIGPGGMPVKDPTAVGYLVRSQPFGPLPEGAESITFDISYGPPAMKTSATMVSINLTKPITR
jgi:hypothetical protein